MNILAASGDFLRRRPDYYYDRQERLAGKRMFILLAMFLYAGVVLVRSWPNFSHPGLYAEDSAHYFNFYYGNIRLLGDILQHPNGYYNIYNNLLAWLIAKADILWQPFLYQTVCLLLCLTTIATFAYSGLIRNRALLLVAPSFLGLTALNHLYYYISLTFQMYVVVLLLLVLLLYQNPASVTARILLFVTCAFLIWSGPYSVLVVPFGLVFLILFRGREIQVIGLLVVTVAYTLSVTESTIMLGNLLNPDIILLWLQTLITDVYFLGLKSSVNAEKLLLVIASLTGLLWLLREDDFFLRMSLLLAVLIISSLAPLFLSNKYLLYRSIFPCHVLVGQFLWVIFLLFAADRLLMKLPRGTTLAGAALACLVVLLVVYDNRRNPDKYQAPILTAMPKFLQAVKAAEEQNLAARGERIEIVTKGTGVFKIAAKVGDRSRSAKRIATMFIE